MNVRGGKEITARHGEMKRVFSWVPVTDYPTAFLIDNGLFCAIDTTVLAFCFNDNAIHACMSLLVSKLISSA